MLIIGVDPGKNGGIVALSDLRNVIWRHVTPLVGTDIDWYKIAELIRVPDTHDKPHVFIEHVHAMHGVAAATTFTFGGCFEGTKALCYALQTPFTLVQPKAWQKLMWAGVPEQRKPPKKLTKKELIQRARGEKVRTPKVIGAINTKAMSAVAVARLFPGVDLRGTPASTTQHDGLIDALLIAEYGRRILQY